MMKKLIPVFLLPIVLFGCSDGTLCCSNNAVISELEESKERWKAYDLSNYSYVQGWSCECLPPGQAQVFVMGEDIKEVKICSDITNAAHGDDVETGCDEAALNRAKDKVITIDSAFALIEEYEKTAHSIDVNYHPEFGYPTKIFIDIVAEMADEEIHFRFSDLKKIDK